MRSSLIIWFILAWKRAPPNPMQMQGVEVVSGGESSG